MHWINDLGVEKLRYIHTHGHVAGANERRNFKKMIPSVVLCRFLK